MVLLQISLPFLLFTKNCLVTSLHLSDHTRIIPIMQKRLQLVPQLVPQLALPLAIAATAGVVAETIAGIGLTTSSPRPYQSK
jgi:hypothetical protein